MAGDAVGSTGGQSGAGGVIAADASADRPLHRETPQLILPDWLRSLTVTRFAPYRIAPFALVAAVPLPVLTANAMRVGVYFGVTGLVAGRVSLTTSDAPTGAVVFRIENESARSGMLADLFSLVTAGWVATADGDCTLTVIEYVRPA